MKEKVREYLVKYIFFYILYHIRIYLSFTYLLDYGMHSQYSDVAKSKCTCKSLTSYAVISNEQVADSRVTTVFYYIFLHLTYFSSTIIIIHLLFIVKKSDNIIIKISVIVVVWKRKCVNFFYLKNLKNHRDKNLMIT